MNETITMKTNEELWLPKLSKWKCYCFGAKSGWGFVYIPLKDHEPNFFWRWMQYLCFGNRWVKEGNK